MPSSASAKFWSATLSPSCTLTLPTLPACMFARKASRASSASEGLSMNPMTENDRPAQVL